MVVIELVREPLSAKKATVKEAEGATRRAAKQEEARAAAAETTSTDDAEELTLTEASDEVEATDGEATEAAAAVALPDGAVAATEDGAAPEGYPVKGNADSGLYHEPDGQWYDQTIAEFWFASADDAEKAGFTKAGSGS
jgi:large subunit ribosomal protein L17